MMKSLFSNKKKERSDDPLADITAVFDGNINAQNNVDVDADAPQEEKVEKTAPLELAKETADSNNSPFDHDTNVNFDECPMAIKSRIGFYEAGIAKKEVMQAIRNIAVNDFGTKKGVYYNIVKYNGGYLYEVHQGCEFGVIKEIIQKVATQDLLLETNDATFKIYVKSNNHVSMLKLRSGDPNIDKFEKLTPKDTLSPLESSGYGMYVFGLGVAILGVVSLSLSSLVKHVLIDQEQAIMYEQTTKVLPSDYINSIQATTETLTEQQYLLYVSYTVNNGWTDELGTIEKLNPDDISDEQLFFVDGEVINTETPNDDVDTQENQ